MINKHPKRKIAAAGGFTLMETLMAVLLLSVALAGPMTIAARGIQAATVSRDQDTAFYLAQEAVEYVRFVRDTNKLNATTDWLAALDGSAPSPAWSGGGSPTVNTANGSGACENANGCYVDSLQNTITTCSASGCPALLYDSANYDYNYTTGSATVFKRAVKIATPVGSNAGEASVTVTVTWSDPLAHTVTVREDIFSWQ